MLKTIELVAGSTFSFAGTVTNLDGSVVWGLSSSVRISDAATDLDAFTCSIAQASDFATSGNWNVSLGATAAQTTAWYAAARNAGGDLLFDLKFYNTAAPDPVLRTDLLKLHLCPPVTP